MKKIIWILILGFLSLTALANADKDDWWKVQEGSTSTPEFIQQKSDKRQIKESALEETNRVSESSATETKLETVEKGEIPESNQDATTGMGGFPESPTPSGGQVTEGPSSAGPSSGETANDSKQELINKLLERRGKK